MSQEQSTLKRLTQWVYLRLKWSREIDPYVKVVLLHSSGYSHILRTRSIINGGSEVVWGDASRGNLLFRIPHQVLKQSSLFRMRLEVMDEELGRDNLLGMRSKNIKLDHKLQTTGGVSQTWTLVNAHGQLGGEVKLSYSVTDLPAEHEGGGSSLSTGGDAKQDGTPKRRGSVSRSITGRRQRYEDDEVSTLVLNIGEATGLMRAATDQADKNIAEMCALVTIAYFGLACVVYSQIEGWTVVECLYFAVVTLTTTGYGDLSPSTNGSKIFTCAFAFCGIAVIMGALGLIGNYLFEQQSRLVNEAIAVMRMHQADLKRLLQEENSSASSPVPTSPVQSRGGSTDLGERFSAVEGEQMSTGQSSDSPGPVTEATRQEEEEEQQASACSGTAMEPAEEEEQQAHACSAGSVMEMAEKEVTLDVDEQPLSSRGKRRSVFETVTHLFSSDGTPVASTSFLGSLGKWRRRVGRNKVQLEAEQQEEEKDMEATEMLRNPVKLSIVRVVQLYVSVILFLVGIGVLVFHFHEEMSWVDSIYLSCISLATVGYGDIHPKSEGGYAFTTVWLLCGTVVIAKAIGSSLTYVMDRQRYQYMMDTFDPGDMNSGRMLHLDSDGDGVISRLEFVTRILVRLRRCTEEDIREIMRVFDSLDKDGSGSLSHDDIDYDDLRKRLKHLPSSAAVAQSTH